MEWTPPDIDALLPPNDCTALKYELSEEEYVKACLVILKDRNRAVRSLFLLLVAAGFIGYLASDPITALKTVGIVLVIVLGLYGWYIAEIKQKIRVSFQRASKCGPVELVFGDGFLGTRTLSGLAGTNILYGMKTFPKFRLVYCSPDVFLIVPLRVFSDETESRKFDQVVSALSARGVA